MGQPGGGTASVLLSRVRAPAAECGGAAGNATADLFPYAEVGETVHVNAYLDGTPVRSNDVHWNGN